MPLQQLLPDGASPVRLWYLCPELVVLALIDDHTTIDDKQLMAVTLCNTVRPQNFDTGKPGQPQFDPIVTKLTEEKPSLAAFITECSWLLFELLGSNAAWLHEQPAIWSDYDDYEYCKSFCSDMMVVNYPAEWAVKGVQDCAQMTRDPAHRDSIILV